MKKNYLMILTLLMVPWLQAATCQPVGPNAPTVYDKARTTINIFEVTINTLKAGFDGVATVMKQDCTQKLCAKLHPDKGDKYKTCLQQDHSTVAEFQKCYVVGAAQPWVDKGVEVGQEGCKLARAAIQLKQDLDAVRDNKELKAKCAGGDKAACDEYTKAVEAICLQVDPQKGDAYKACVAGKPVGAADWMAVAKRSACVAYSSLKIVPANPKYDLYINMARGWLKGFGGCVD